MRRLLLVRNGLGTRRLFHTSVLDIPLSEPLPGIPENTSGVFKGSPATEITTLENGVRVASTETFDLTSCVGIGLDVGTRYEAPEERGMSTLLKRLLLSSSDEGSGQQIAQELESIGASVIRSEGNCKDSIYVAAEILRPHCKDFLSILRRSASSSFSQADLDFQKQSMIFEHEDHMMDPDAFLPETLMGAGLKCPLGLSAVPDPASIEAVTMEKLLRFRDRHFVGPSVVVGGTGVDHQELVEYARDLFSDLPAEGKRPSFPLEYHGGDSIQVEDARVAERQRLITGQDSTRIHLAFAAPSVLDPDFYAVSVLMALMGGGSSFSSGGPGKGMYTRLYTRVLNRWRFVQEAKCFMFPFEDVSLFGFACKTDPYASVSMLEVMASELLYMATEIGDEEFARAKNKLKSDMFMDLESRIVQIDDLMRQVLLWNKRMSASEHATLIDTLTKEQVNKVARKIISGAPPTMVAYGPQDSVQVLPSAHRVQGLLADNLKP